MPFAEHYPDAGPTGVDASRLSDADAALATAIHRTAVQRWLTLAAVLDGHLRQPMHRLEPVAAASLAAGAAQVLFLDRLPGYAVVDETVAAARRVADRRGRAVGGLVNAVLRRVAARDTGVEPGVAWDAVTTPRDRVPLGPSPESGSVRLGGDSLPDPARGEAGYLQAATSHPTRLIRRWIEQYGRERALALLLHGLQNPPTIVAVGGAVEGAGEGSQESDQTLRRGLLSVGVDENKPVDAAEVDLWQPHDQPGFIVWQGDRGSLAAFLAEDPRRRVQDPASAEAVAATRDLRPRRILDLCAGRGTKTRQLALLHPDAEVVASDPDPDRFASLQGVAETLPNVLAVTPDHIVGRFDLVLLDVPCSNTAVTARRPEARYRYTHRHLQSLLLLQRRIIGRGVELASPQARILYSTCSLEDPENAGGTKTIVKLTGGTVERGSLRLPDGSGAAYHDGGYHALVRLP